MLQLRLAKEETSKQEYEELRKLIEKQPLCEKLPETLLFHEKAPQ
jgi:hypothetical protein